MKEFKAKVKQLPKEFYEEVNKLLKKHGVDDGEVDRIKLHHTKKVCSDGKELYCYTDSNGNTHCRCI